MPPVSKGNKLTTLQLQPGWVIEADGFGLLTSRLTFKCDASIAESKKPKENEAHPKNPLLFCHRSSYVINESDIATITAEYVGIASGTMTKVQITGDIALGTQPIQTHPKFYKGTAGTTGKPLKDLGWDEATQSFPESSLDAIKYALVGVKSFQSPDLQFTGSYYTNSKATLLDNQLMIGKTFKTIGGQENIVLPQTFAAISVYHTRFAMVTAVSYEQFANIYKVRYSIRVATGGWNSLIFEQHN